MGLAGACQESDCSGHPVLGRCIFDWLICFGCLVHVVDVESLSCALRINAGGTDQRWLRDWGLSGICGVSL